MHTPRRAGYWLALGVDGPIRDMAPRMGGAGWAAQGAAMTLFTRTSACLTSHGNEVTGQWSLCSAHNFISRKVRMANR